MKIVFFGYNERFRNPIVRTQLFNLVSLYARTHPELNIRLCIFQNPLVYISEFFVRQRLLRDFANEQFIVKVYPLALPTRGAWISMVGVKLHKSLFSISAYLISGKIIVARGYIAGYLSLQLLQQKKIPKLIFDPRSLFVQENTNTRWTDGTAQQKFWKKIELDLVTNASAVIAVNSPMGIYYRNLSKLARIAIIPIFTKSPGAYPIPHNQRKSKLQIIYIGSLGQSKWNSTESYIKFLNALSVAREQVELVFVITSRSIGSKTLEAEAKRIGFKCKIWYSVQHDDAMKLATESDIGLIIGDTWEDSAARTGIKTIEYLSASLRVWTTQQVQDVANLVQTNGIGFVFSSSSPSATEINCAIHEARVGVGQTRNRIEKTYAEKYSPTIVLQRYHQLITS